MELVPVRPEQKEQFWNIFQKYLYEMTAFYDDDLDENGNYPYPYFEAYFTQPERKALYLVEEGVPVGFAMVIPYSSIGETPDHVMAEFTIFPRYRKRRLAASVVEALFRQYPGSWEIKYHEANLPAKKLWTGVAAPYHPRRIALNDQETVLAFSTC